MTTQIEAMKMALEALDISQSLQEQWKSNHHSKTLSAYYVLKSAIEEAENVEPIAWALQMPNEPYPRQIWTVKDDPFNAAMQRWPEAYQGATQVPLYLHPSSAEIEELRKDAARYRYLRTPKAGKHKVMFWLNEPARYVDLSWNELDYAIDSAMEKQP